MKSVIILPTYNERENVGLLIKEIFSVLPEISILVVDDNSPDGTGKAVLDLVNQYPNLELLERQEKSGLGSAYIAGFRKVLEDSEIVKIMMMDSDFSHNPKYLPQLFAMGRSYDLVIGSRYVSGGGILKWEFWRKFLSALGNFYARLLLGKGVYDWTGGFNCINAEFLKKIDLASIDLSGYAFIIGLKYFLVEAGARVKEIPIIFEARRGGESKISNHIIREGVIAPWKLIFGRQK